ncbi:MAG: antibiotic biosynthesis monooxygenase [Planctomycetota bacterium]
MPRSLENRPQPDPFASGATAVITHRVKPGREPDYETWLTDITAVVADWPGHLDKHLIRPVPGVTHTYVVVLRFRDQPAVESWMNSAERRDFIDRVRPILADDDRFHIQSGLDFWFVPEGANAQVPVRWKQALVTWSAIYPLVLLAPVAILPLLRAARLPESIAVDTLISTGVLVVLMVYLIMPHYTRLVRRWLFA